VIAELDAALGDLDSRELGFDDRIHECRKSIKRLRALLELVQRPIGRAAFQRCDSSLRDVAHALGPLRERAALDERLDALEERLGSEADFSPLRSLIAPKSLQAPEQGARTLEAAKADLKLIRGRLEALVVDGNDWDVIADDFRRTYAAGRKAHRHAGLVPGPEQLHALRRRAKRHQHQLALLEPIWPGPIKARRHELATLGEELGEHHDLALLEATLERSSIPPALSAARVRLLSQIARRSRELETSALGLAARVYAERPSRLSDRFGAYFGIWRNGFSAPS
jgi:CHAD domain-containing protein